MKFNTKSFFKKSALLFITSTVFIAVNVFASDCAQRLNDWGSGPSAALVVENNRALMVYVPYGSSGWDFPGGYNKGSERSCETAEREGCEESGYRLRATGKVSNNVFRAERTGGGCSIPVDEGFLQTRWVANDEIDSLQMRPGSWGDKRAILKQQLSSGSLNNNGGSDACGCQNGQGWSSTYGECRWGSETDSNEAWQCQNNQSQQSNSADACGCTNGQGWSSTYGECRWGSETDSNEAWQCQNNPSGGSSQSGWHPSCESYMIEALGRFAPNSSEVEGMRWNTEPVSWRACVEQYQQNGQASSGNSGGSSSDLICVFDYDLTLSSHYCPATVNRPEFACTNVGPTYGWTEQCLAIAAREAVQRCLAEGARVAVASHSPYDQAKINALGATGWPSGSTILMQPGRNKGDMIRDIRASYGMPNATVLFWDDTDSNIGAANSAGNVFSVRVDRGDPRGSNCGIQSSHIGAAWGQIRR